MAKSYYQIGNIYRILNNKDSMNDCLSNVKSILERIEKETGYHDPLLGNIK